MALTHALSTNNYGNPKFIVATSAANGTHTTLTTAMADAVSGDTIALRDSVTENVTVTSGVNVISLGAGGSLNVPSITGTLTMTAAGTSTISGLRLVTNSAALIAVTGSAASILNIKDCYLNCSNNTGITFSAASTSAAINIINCKGDLGTTGIALFSHSSTGVLSFNGSVFSNSGASTTASTVSAGTIDAKYSVFQNPITTSSTATTSLNWVDIDCTAINTTALTHGGSGASSRAAKSIFLSGSAAAVSIGATLTMDNCEINSSNGTAVISGAGTLQYTPFTFTNSGQKITVTTQTPLNYGTWTPTLLGTVAGVTTYTAQVGYYTIVGNLVYIEGVIGISAATGTGNAIIGGFPFTVKNLSSYFPIGNISLSSAAWAWAGATGTQLNFRPQANTTTALVDSLKSTGAAFLQMTNGAATFGFSAWYQI